VAREPEDAAAPSRDGVLVSRAVARANGDQALFRVTMGTGPDDVPTTSAALGAEELHDALDEWLGSLGR
jgi:hypothetical protein